MVDDRPPDTGPSGGPPDLGRPKRTPPTIDLDASEVTSTTAASETGAGAGSADVAADSSDPAGIDQAGIDNAAPEPDAAAPRRPSRMSTVLISACTGAIAGAVVVGLTTLAGWPDSSAPEPLQPQVSAEALDALSARIARVEARPAPSSASADPAIGARIDALDKSLAALRGDLAAARGQSERTAAAVNDLKSAPREPAVAAVDLSPINERLGQVERTASALKTEAAQQSAKPVDDRLLRRVVAASLLDGSVKQSEPYAAALAAAKPLAADANALKPLDAFAATGVPSAATLSRDLLALLAKLAPAQDSVATTGSFVDRLQAGAAKLVRIQRTDAVAGNDREAVLARITVAARGNDIGAARREVNALPPADRAALQPWIDKADARDAALAASRQFAADATAALSKPAP
jgi:hypothetical protein